uniref:hypothetical protein n=1 Tax=Roseivirga sp. TaxID=1964215 RepID=UPI0040473FF5
MEKIKIEYNAITGSYGIIDENGNCDKFRIRSHLILPRWTLELQSKEPVEYKVKQKGLQPRYDLVPKVIDLPKITYEHTPPHATFNIQNKSFNIDFHKDNKASFYKDNLQIGSIRKSSIKNFINYEYILLSISNHSEEVKRMAEIFLTIDMNINTDSGLTQFSDGERSFEDYRSFNPEWPW